MGDAAALPARASSPSIPCFLELPAQGTHFSVNLRGYWQDDCGYVTSTVAFGLLKNPPPTSASSRKPFVSSQEGVTYTSPR